MSKSNPSLPGGTSGRRPRLCGAGLVRSVGRGRNWPAAGCPRPASQAPRFWGLGGTRAARGPLFRARGSGPLFARAAIPGAGLEPAGPFRAALFKSADFANLSTRAPNRDATRHGSVRARAWPMGRARAGPMGRRSRVTDGALRPAVAPRGGPVVAVRSGRGRAGASPAGHCVRALHPARAHDDKAWAPGDAPTHPRPDAARKHPKPQLTQCYGVM